MPNLARQTHKPGQDPVKTECREIHPDVMQRVLHHFQGVQNGRIALIIKHGKVVRIDSEEMELIGVN